MTVPEPASAAGLPAWARCALAIVPLGAGRTEVESDFAELFSDRSQRYGSWYAHRRLSADIVSLWRGTPRGGHVFQDLRFGLRLFRKHPLPVGLAVAGLALSIGVVTAVFSLVNATKLRPFAMDDPYTVVRVMRPLHEDRFFGPAWSYARFLDLRGAKSVSTIEAAMEDTGRVGTTADAAGPERSLLFVSGGYLHALGGRPSLGRSLTAADDVADAPPVVVMSHELWLSEFQGDSAKVGSTVWISGAPATLVGVLQPGFTGPVTRKPAVWAPFAAFDDLLAVEQTRIVNGRTPASMTGEPFGPASRTLVDVIARLAPGVSAAAAEGELSGIATRAAAIAPGADPNAKPVVVRIFSAASPIDGPEAAESWMEIAAILGVVGLVLAVACANTANLLLAAAATRTREIGVRLALGATTRRLLVQMVSESLMLGLSAGGLGFLFALWFSPLLGAMVGIEAGVNTAPDVKVLVFTIVVALVCGVGAGVAPARFGARGNLLAVLQSSGGGAGRTSMPSKLRTSFVGFQAAVSMLLLVAAALLARTAIHVTRMDVGFDVDRVLTAAITTPAVGPNSSFDEPAFVRRAVDAVRAIPSVESVGLSEYRPFGTSRALVRIEGYEESYTLLMIRSSAEYFPAAGMRLVRGRFFSDDEVAASAPVALISESVAGRFFQGADPIGQALSSLPAGARGLSDLDKSATIIGVVADAMLHRIHSEGFGSVHRPINRLADTPKAQNAMSPPTLIVRSKSPVAIARQVEDALRSLDPRVRPSTWILRGAVDEFLGGSRVLAWLAGPMAGLALVLAALGVYGVTAFVVSRRTQEVSVRMALGASSADVLRLLVGDSLRPVLIGLGVGLVIAIGAGRVFASLFTGISPHDPIAIGVSAATLLAAALIAVVVPARRAAKVDPAAILRES